MPRIRTLLFTLALLAACSSGGGGGDPTPDPDPNPNPPDPPDPQPPVELTLGLQEVVTGLADPLRLTAPPGDARLFIVEKGGRIRIVRNGALLPTPFLDVSALVSNGNEQGLLGLAFDPQYAGNGRFFIDYTDTDGNTVVASYRVSSDPDVADPASAVVRLRVDQPYSNHNGGHLLFGPDGFLYVGLGDGGSAGDPQRRGQDPRDLFGSMLRIDVSGATGYTSPGSNPHGENAAWAPEVWNIGLRNPWRFTFDRATGDLYIGDVGQGDREEIDVSPAASGAGRAQNFGWPITEGAACYGASSCDRTGLVEPVLDYTHADGCSVTGGIVYRGPAIPQLAGTYFYSDYCSDWVRSFRYAGGQATERTEWPTLSPGSGVLSFGEDTAGELYILSANGGVFRIVAQ
jgi:glucose/arabinose dehydrogenase